MKKAIILINFGTPEAATKEAVRSYLKEFLWDPRIVQIPRFIWWFILNFIVLKSRPEKSTKAYQRVWMDEGSPLKVFSERIQHKLQLLADTKHPNQYDVILAMRYGQPSINSVIKQLDNQGYEKIIAFPLYPQQATSSTGTAWHAFQQGIRQLVKPVKNKLIPVYYEDTGYINALADSVREHWLKNGNAGMLLISFHGVPERTIKQGDPYLEHCTATAIALARSLGLNSEQWQMVFQSRFGRGGWIKPYCNDVLQQLPNSGIKELDVICPGFAVDCLETLDEMAVENRDVFIAAGGQEYRYIPALNDSDKHIEVLLSLIESNSEIDG